MCGIRNLDTKPPVQRYKQEHPGDLIHIDVKKQGRFRKVVTASQATGSRVAFLASDTHGSTCVTFDDATRLANVELLPDKPQCTTIGFMNRTLVWFNGHGVECRQVMSHNGSAYISKAFAKA